MSIRMAAPGWRLALALPAIFCSASPLAAQSLFKYLGPDGVWVFADRPPDSSDAYEEVALDRSDPSGLVRIYQTVRDDGAAVLVAENSFWSPVQIAFELVSVGNLSPEVPTRGNMILPERSQTELLSLVASEASSPVRIEFRYQYIHGHPRARHRPREPYRLPYALANSHRVSQAFPDQLTHTDEANRHAIDFEMPIGTGVYSARAGTVIEVASDYFDSGLDPDLYGSRANIVRVLHGDGTLALYGHLNWNSIRVVEGQRIARGEYIADSGNTGFSSGPHLHFVVQRNAGGLVESVPVEFAGLGGTKVSVTTGDRPVAY